MNEPWRRSPLFWLLIGILVLAVLIAWSAVPDCWQWSVSC